MESFRASVMGQPSPPLHLRPLNDDVTTTSFYQPPTPPAPITSSAAKQPDMVQRLADALVSCRDVPELSTVGIALMMSYSNLERESLEWLAVVKEKLLHAKREQRAELHAACRGAEAALQELQLEAARQNAVLNARVETHGRLLEAVNNANIPTFHTKFPSDSELAAFHQSRDRAGAALDRHTIESGELKQAARGLQQQIGAASNALNIKARELAKCDRELIAITEM